jgi:hypothetical protein
LSQATLRNFAKSESVDTTVREYSSDYAAERASGVVSDCARLGIELPAELLGLMPEWSALLD